MSMELTSRDREEISTQTQLWVRKIVRTIAEEPPTLSLPKVLVWIVKGELPGGSGGILDAVRVQLNDILRYMNIDAVNDEVGQIRITFKRG